MYKRLVYVSAATLFVVIPLLYIQSAVAQNPTAQAQTLEKYVGQYQVSEDFFVSVMAENGKLMVQATNQPKVELLAQSSEDFTVQGTPIKLTFVKDAQGQVTGMVIHQGGQDIPAKKISSQAAPPQGDKSPHKSSFVTANGIKMHYLDWGGTGDVLLLLTGFGNDAHVYDDFAPKFTDRFHVIALTRRGFGETDKPATGYDTATRVEDIRQFLDALKIQKANIVGHSLAGDELTLFATLYPRRVIKLVYLDAAYDRSKNFDCSYDPPGGLPPLQKRLIMEALGCPGASQIVVKDMPPPDVYNVFVSTGKAASSFHPDYTKVKVPALAIYADIEKPETPPNLDAETSKKFAAWWQANQVPKSRASIEQFRREMKGGQVVEVKDAGHYVFRGKTEDEVVRLVREFLLK